MDYCERESINLDSMEENRDLSVNSRGHSNEKEREVKENRSLVSKQCKRL